MKEQIESENNRVILISGASSGIGRATAEFLTDKGFVVFGTAREPEKHEVSGLKLLPLDVRDDDSVKRCVDAVLERCGRLDVLINNAGFALYGGIEETTVEQAKAVFDTNFFGAMRLTNAVLPAMRRQKSGRIVNVSSVVGFLPAPFMGIYAAGKHALEGFSESLDHEVRKFGIRVVLVEPAFTKTDIDRNVQAAAQPLSIYEAERRRVVEKISHSVSRGDNPLLTAKVIHQIIESRQPKLRYPVGKQARILKLLRRLLPSKMIDRSLRKEFRLDLK